MQVQVNIYEDDLFIIHTSNVRGKNHHFYFSIKDVDELSIVIVEVKYFICGLQIFAFTIRVDF